MDDATGWQHVATFCGQCSCGCPELHLDPDADDARRGALDHVLAGT